MFISAAQSVARNELHCQLMRPAVSSHATMPTVRVSSGRAGMVTDLSGKKSHE